jgi:hypothetical protein
MREGSIVSSMGKDDGADLAARIAELVERGAELAHQRWRLREEVVWPEGYEGEIPRFFG